MKNSNEYYQILKKMIENDCFFTKEARAASRMSGGKDEWLFDFRVGSLRYSFLNAYSEIFWERYKDEPLFQVCGIEMAAIPLLISIIGKFHENGREINGFIIRKSRKKSGLFKMVEGKVTEEPVIIIDDLINSGSSIIKQIEVVNGLEKEIKEVFTILRFRDIEYYTFIKNKNINLYSIFSLNDFKETLGVSNLLPSNDEPIESPFDSKVVWYFKGISPNYFYVVPKSGPVVSDDKVFFGTDDGTFFARRIETGEDIWKYKVPFGSAGKFIFSTPGIYNNLVIFGAYDGNLYALDKRTGKRVWVFAEADWIGSSVCISEEDGMVFVGLEFGLFKKHGGIVGINANNGEKKWEFHSSELTHGTPAYSKKFNVVACGSNDGMLYALDAKTGKLKWSFQTEGPIKYAPCFSDKHGFIVVLGHSEVVYVLDTITGKTISTYKMDFGGYSTPLIVGDKVVCTSFDKNIHCFDIFTGNLVWKYNTGARCFATPVLVDGKIYVGSNNAALFEIDGETGNVSGVFYTRERIVNKIAYDPKTKIFFIPTFANEIFALKKK